LELAVFDLLGHLLYEKTIVADAGETSLGGDLPGLFGKNVSPRLYLFQVRLKAGEQIEHRTGKILAVGD
jgi:hypothetical protein